MSELHTVDDVLHALDEVVERSLEVGSRLGYFAAIYRKVTAKVAEGIAAGFFDDGERMQRLDVTFAARYLSALRAYQRGDTLTRSWSLAFEATTNARPIVLQHLLTGINAHINLDLGIAAAETAPGATLPALRRDFDRVNEILALTMVHIRRALAEVSPWIGLLDRLGDATTTRSRGSALRSHAPRHGGSPPSSRRSRALHGAAPSAHATHGSHAWLASCSTRAHSSR